MAMPSLKVREDRLRRLLKSKGYRLLKTPARSWLRWYGAGYSAVDCRNVVVFFCWNHMYQGTIEQAEEFAVDADDLGIRL